MQPQGWTGQHRDRSSSTPSEPAGFSEVASTIGRKEDEAVADEPTSRNTDLKQDSQSTDSQILASTTAHSQVQTEVQDFTAQGVKAVEGKDKLIDLQF